MQYIDIPVGEYAPEAFNVVVEVPKGSTNKYEYDVKLNIFRLDRSLGSMIQYPGEYGFVPRTQAADGCPLDALVLTKDGTFPGCVVESRAVGVFSMVDHGVQDFKLICVPTCEPRLDWLQSYRNLDDHSQNEIKHFFRVYKELHGKETITQGWQGVGAAKEILRSAIERFNKRFVAT
jgi:inorganic pyrophosphatase